VVNELVKEYILDRHIEVAIRKLYTEGLATFRFLREDNMYRHSEIEYDYVGNTSPRLKESLQMMTDLKIVNETKEGFRITDEEVGFKSIVIVSFNGDLHSLLFCRIYIIGFVSAGREIFIDKLYFGSITRRG